MINSCRRRVAVDGSNLRDPIIKSFHFSHGVTCEFPRYVGTRLFDPHCSCSTLYCYGWSCHIRVCVCVEADALRPRAARYDGRARPFSVRHLCSLLSTHMTSYSTCVQSRMMGAMQNHVGEWAICQKARKETCPTEFDGPTTPLRGCSSPDPGSTRAQRQAIGIKLALLVRPAQHSSSLLWTVPIDVTSSDWLPGSRR